MDTILEHFIHTHPKDAAIVLEACLPEELLVFVNEIGTTNFAFLPYLSSDKVMYLLKHVPAEKVPYIIRTLSDTQMASFIKLLAAEQKDLIFEHMSEDQKYRINRLLDFNDTEVGYYAQKPKLIIFEHHTVQQALEALTNSKETDLPIYLVNAEFQFVGIVDIVKLIQVRDQPNLTLNNVYTKKVKVISASSPLEGILNKKVWGQSRSMVVTGKNNFFLGVISMDVLRQRSHKPTHEIKKSSVEEYIFFSEMLWAGLSKFWGTLK